MPKKEIIIDKSKCIGCGTCAAICPEYFILEGDKAKALKPVTADQSCVKEAETSCPTSAISVKKD